MENKNLVRGVIYAIISLILVSIQPIIVISKPAVIDAYLFAATTIIIEAIIFCPLMVIERKRIKHLNRNDSTKKDERSSSSNVNGWKKKNNLIFLLYISINFAIAQIMFFLSYQFGGGAILISITQQTTIIFGLFFGFLITRERISNIQIIFSFFLLFGLTIAITQLDFNNLLEINVGVIFMLITASMWTLAHSITRRVFNANEIAPIQLAFIRNALGGVILISTYFLFFPLENLNLFFVPINLFYMILMGVVYAGDLLFWYLGLKHINISKIIAITSPMPLLAALFAMIFLNETFTIFHLIGAFIVIISIVMIVIQTTEENHDR